MAGLVLAVAGVRLVRGLMGPGDPGLVVVVPFEADSDADHVVAVQVSRALAEALDDAGELHTTDWSDLSDFLGGTGVHSLSPRKSRKVARHFGAAYYIRGSVVPAGDSVEVRASLYRRGQRGPVASVPVRNLRSNAAQIAGTLAYALMVRTRRNPRVGLATEELELGTTWPAYKSYLRGEAALRSGLFPQAAEHFTASSRQDPRFAGAWYGATVAAVWGGQYEPILWGRHGLEARVTDGLPPADDLAFRGLLAALSGEAGRADNLYTSALQQHSDKVSDEVRRQTAELFVHYSAFDRELDGERALAGLRTRAADYRTAYLALLVALRQGEARQSRAALARLREVNRDSTREPAFAVLEAALRGDTAARALPQLRTASDTTLSFALRLLREHWHASAGPEPGSSPLEAVARHMAEPGRERQARLMGRLTLARTEAARGRWAPASRQLAELEDANQRTIHLGHYAVSPFLALDDSVLRRVRDAVRAWTPHYVGTANAWTDARPLTRFYLLGLLSARLGDERAMAGALDSISALRVSGGPSAAPEVPALADQLHRSVRATWLQRQGEHARALETLGELRPPPRHLYEHPIYALQYERFLRAELLGAAGPTDDAVQAYDALAEDVQAGLYLAPSLFRSAELLWEQDRLTEARERYARFLRLWQESDARYRRVREKARARGIGAGR